MCDKDEIKSKSVFTFFSSYPKLMFPQKERHFMHINVYADI